MANHQRSRSAILGGAKSVIAEVGSYESNMLDIAEHAQVSRATVYNHFSDKEEMMLTLLESEIARLESIGKQAGNPAEALFAISREISTDVALRKMVETDPLDIAKFVTVTDHWLWGKVQAACDGLFGSEYGSLAMHWFISQIGASLSEEQSRNQADLLGRIFAGQ